MILRSFHLPPGMDEELRMLSFISGDNKATLVRKMIASGLKQAWTELESGQNQLSLNNAIVDHARPSDQARTVMQSRI